MADYDPLDGDADPFRPPAISTSVTCLHCGEEYDSYRIEWRVAQDAQGKSHGFWCCPTPDCGGMGFGFDIFPVDPEYSDERGGWMSSDDDEEEEWDEEELSAGRSAGDGAAEEAKRYASPEDELPW